MNGVDLDYVDEGTGIPVVFSHGGGSDLRYWEPQRHVIAARYRFVTYSRRFHGQGPWPTSGDYSSETHVADLVELIRRLPGPVHLVGFSTALALRATIAAPDLIRTLTIVEPNVPWLLEHDIDGAAILASWRTENERIATEAAGNRERAAKLWFELVNNRGSGKFDTQPTGLRRMWLDNYGAERPTAPPPEPLTCEQLGTISVPTLAIAAEHGMTYSRKIIDVLVRCISDSCLVVVPGATHFMSYQLPTVFNDVLLDFLARDAR